MYTEFHIVQPSGYLITPMDMHTTRDRWFPKIGLFRSSKCEGAGNGGVGKPSRRELPNTHRLIEPRSGEALHYYHTLFFCLHPSKNRAEISASSNAMGTKRGTYRTHQLVSNRVDIRCCTVVWYSQLLFKSSRTSCSLK